MNNNEAALRNAARLYPLDDFSQALTDLRYKRKSIFELPPAVIVDDFKFAEANPDHPDAHTNRFTRMTASDFFNALAEANPSLIDSQMLSQLHEALFDRCPSVRLNVAETLEKLARSESITFLEQLRDAEDESQAVRDTVAKALARCRDFDSKRI